MDGAIEIKNKDKVLFAAAGITRGALGDYYLSIADAFLNAVGGRPTMMQRYPEGAGGPSFFQKRVPDNAPDWLQTTVVSTPNGTTSNALVLADVDHVIWALNLGCLGFHVWPYRADQPDTVDELRIDLDPQPGIGFSEVRAATAVLHELFDEIGLVAFPKTSGNRGIHIYARLELRWDAIAVRRAAVALARELERRAPELITAAWWKEERGERVFVDFNQNAPHKTVFGAWSVRDHPDALASTPFAWEELSEIDPVRCTVATVPARVRDLGDPWGAMANNQSIATLLAWADRDEANGLSDAPWPPVYPKMPGEPPRVAPSRAKKTAS